MDGLMTDKWIPQLVMTEEQIFEDRPMSHYFENNGYSSMNVMKNLGSTSVYLIMIILILFFHFLILTPLSRYKKYALLHHLHLIDVQI